MHQTTSTGFFQKREAATLLWAPHDVPKYETFQLSVFWTLFFWSLSKAQDHCSSLEHRLIGDFKGLMFLLNFFFITVDQYSVCISTDIVPIYLHINLLLHSTPHSWTKPRYVNSSTWGCGSVPTRSWWTTLFWLRTPRLTGFCKLSLK